MTQNVEAQCRHCNKHTHTHTHSHTTLEYLENTSPILLLLKEEFVQTSTCSFLDLSTKQLISHCSEHVLDTTHSIQNSEQYGKMKPDVYFHLQKEKNTHIFDMSAVGLNPNDVSTSLFSTIESTRVI